METNMESSSEQGLLDLTVELSTSDVTAGNEFAIFVLVKNPFSKPVWIREVNVSLPSELIRVDAEKIQEKIKETEESRQKQSEESKQERIQLKEKIDGLQQQIDELTRALKSDNDNSETISTLIHRLERDLDIFREKLQYLNLGSIFPQSWGNTKRKKRVNFGAC
jgi:septal ring factor EnvC (AmiA/AmiB activator)